MLNDESLAARVIAVGFAPAEALARYEQGLGLGDVLVLSDPDRQTYRAFALGRASFRRVWLDPRVWARYAALIARGRRLRPAEDDTLQLGGDVLTDAAGRVRWIHRSRGPEDRPSLATVAREIEKIHQAPGGEPSGVSAGSR